jgi:transcriptional regulator with XRE-family HTH domain
MIERFPEKLRTLRERHGLSQGQLAQQLGVNRTYVNLFERGRRMPGTELMLKIANIFGVSADVLMRDELELDDG